MRFVLHRGCRPIAAGRAGLAFCAVVLVGLAAARASVVSALRNLRRLLLGLAVTSPATFFFVISTPPYRMDVDCTGSPDPCAPHAVASERAHLASLYRCFTG